MKNPFKHGNTPENQPSQQQVTPTPPAISDVSDADLKQVQGGVSFNYSTLQATYTKQDDTGPANSSKP